MEVLAQGLKKFPTEDTELVGFGLDQGPVGFDLAAQGLDAGVPLLDDLSKLLDLRL